MDNIDYSNTVETKSRTDILTIKYGKRYSEYRQKWDRRCKLEEDIPKYPLQYDIMLTDKCNLRCNICHRRNRTGVSLSKDSLQMIFSEGRQHGLCACSFGNDSEGLIDLPLLYDAISIAKNNNVMDVFVATNGILLDYETSEKLIEEQITMLNVSLDAVSDKTYSLIRNQNILDKIEDNITNFVNLREKRGGGLPEIRLSFCETYLNAKEKDLFIEKWKDIVDKVDIQHYISVQGQLQDLKDGIRVHSDFCMDPFRRVSIFADGDVSCCCSFRDDDVIIGSIHENTIKEIWNGKKNKRIQMNFLQEKDAIPNYCKKCLNNRWTFN